MNPDCTIVDNSSDTRKSKVLRQFIMYLFAGGFAFVVDFGVLVACRELAFKDIKWGVYASVIVAFMAGHVANYLLSMWIVFSSQEERRKGFTARAFWLFALCALGGMGVTEVGMWIGYGLMNFHYVLIKVIMAAIVFALNFIGRKLIVSR